MALTDIEKIRILIGDTEGSPFYMLLTDNEIQAFLDLTGGNVMQAARLAAIAASMQLAGWTTRERTGDIEVWSNLSTQYLKALENLIDESAMGNYGALRPYFGGIDWCTVQSYKNDPNNVRSDLARITDCTTSLLPGGVILINVVQDEDGNHGDIIITP